MELINFRTKIPTGLNFKSTECRKNICLGSGAAQNLTLIYNKLYFILLRKFVNFFEVFQPIKFPTIVLFCIFRQHSGCWMRVENKMMPDDWYHYPKRMALWMKLYGASSAKSRRSSGMRSFATNMTHCRIRKKVSCPRWSGWSGVFNLFCPGKCSNQPDLRSFQDNKKRPDFFQNQVFLVEIIGIEPMTSWMPFKRSPSWAIPPYFEIHRLPWEPLTWLV